ncbi:MAG TPA: hypothetical protein VFV87_19185 [Pirellulaceae bacterium]|nr:hypothetical protein [Pirellulaceae bacterium]
MRADLREDGWWLIFDGGEEAGPFKQLDDAQAFLDLVDNLQRQQKQDNNSLDSDRSTPA